MPSPISGVGIAAAENPLRIIELDQVIDTDISLSMNFAIDFTNQTLRMTGLQFTDWLSATLTIEAEKVIFDPTVFEQYFTGTPPTTAQSATDFGFPILRNADISNVGKVDTPTLNDLNLATVTGVLSYDSTALNIPSSVGGKLFTISRGSQSISQMVIDTDNRFFWRDKLDGIFSQYEEVASHSYVESYVGANFVTLDTDQTISGLKTFTNSVLLTRFDDKVSLGVTGFTSTGVRFASEGQIILGGISSGGAALFLRPSGALDETNQTIISSNGDMNVQGKIEPIIPSVDLGVSLQDGAVRINAPEDTFYSVLLSHSVDGLPAYSIQSRNYTAASSSVYHYVGGIRVIELTLYGATFDHNVTCNAPEPLAPDHLTKKSYVDGTLAAAVQLAKDELRAEFQQEITQLKADLKAEIIAELSGN